MDFSYPKSVGISVVFGLMMIFLWSLVWPGGFSSAEAAETIALPAQAVAPGDSTLTVNLELPAGCKFNQEAPSTLGLKSADFTIVAVDEKYAQNLSLANLPLSLTVPCQRR